jgi:hypothetical protein
MEVEGSWWSCCKNKQAPHPDNTVSKQVYYKRKQISLNKQFQSEIDHELAQNSGFAVIINNSQTLNKSFIANFG